MDFFYIISLSVLMLKYKMLKDLSLTINRMYNNDGDYDDDDDENVDESELNTQKKIH